MSSPLRDLSDAVDRMVHVRPDGIEARDNAAEDTFKGVELRRQGREVTTDDGPTPGQ